MDLIPGIDLPPSCRISWTSPRAQEVWEPRVAAAAQAYSILERETVKHGLRSCTTTHINPDRLNQEMAELAKDGLVFLPRVKVGSYAGFAHRHPAVEQGKPWNWYGPVGNSIKAVYEFVEAERRGDHRTVAKLLGYPSCCSEFFSTVWLAGYIDPVWQAAERTIDTDSHLLELKGDRLHLTWFGSRYNGIRLTPHLACSFDCAETQQRSQAWLDLGRNLKVPGLSELIDLLNMPVEWNCLHGIAWITTPLYRLVTNSVGCHPRFVVRKHGAFIPKESARGLVFPFRAN